LFYSLHNGKPTHLSTDAVATVVNTAAQTARANCPTVPEHIHADRGCARLGITQSMGRPGSALDNSVIESWHCTLEFELRSLEQFATKAAARTRVAAWAPPLNPIDVPRRVQGSHLQPQRSIPRSLPRRPTAAVDPGDLDDPQPAHNAGRHRQRLPRCAARTKPELQDHH
jgi:hypothetical protein